MVKELLLCKRSLLLLSVGHEVEISCYYFKAHHFFFCYEKSKCLQCNKSSVRNVRKPLGK